MFRILQGIAVALGAVMLCASEPEFRWTDRAVEVSVSSALPADLPLPQWQSIFSVHAEQSDPIRDITLPPIHGIYKTIAGAIRFEPAFPFQPGINYRAVFRPSKLPNGSGATVASKHRIEPRPRTPTTQVTAIYPTVNKLPENLLKFYLHFTAPMSGGRIYDHIELRDVAADKAVELPFLEIDEELWDQDMQRLTLFLDPGRIKRGVKPLEDIGPSFHVGRTYLLSISSNWLDANGIPLKSSFEKKFTVVDADRDPPDPKHWKVHAPKAGTRDAVVLEFDEPMDQAISARTITASLPGSPEFEPGETRWRFKPSSPWPRGQHEIRIPTLIEDLAGNNVGEPFDVDAFEGRRRYRTNAIVSLPFTVR